MSRVAHATAPFVLVALALAGSPAAAGEADPTAETVAALRNAGTLLFSWVVDNVPAADERAEAEEPAEYDWAACPAVSYEEAKALVDPRRAEELRATDGWGHPLEYCLRQGDLGAPGHVLGVRSPGRDGRFSGSVYPVGEFAPDDLDHDIVWMDGYFVTWPGKADS